MQSFLLAEFAGFCQWLFAAASPSITITGTPVEVGQESTPSAPSVLFYLFEMCSHHCDQLKHVEKKSEVEVEYNLSVSELN